MFNITGIIVGPQARCLIKDGSTQAVQQFDVIGFASDSGAYQSKIRIPARKSGTVHAPRRSPWVNRAICVCRAMSS